jgi:hypothetical protein
VNDRKRGSNKNATLDVLSDNMMRGKMRLEDGGSGNI